MHTAIKLTSLLCEPYKIQRYDDALAARIP